MNDIDEKSISAQVARDPHMQAQAERAIDDIEQGRTLPFQVLENYARKELTEEEQEILKQANDLVAPYGLKAEFLGDDVFSVGVQGDQRSYTRVINLVGEYPGDDVLRELSNKICNNLKINRVTIEIV